MGLLDFANIQYTNSQATSTASQQVGATTSINPFLPAASAYPMGASLFVNPDYCTPMMPTFSATDFGLLSKPSLFNFGSSLSSLSLLNNNILISKIQVIKISIK